MAVVDALAVTPDDPRQAQQQARPPIELDGLGTQARTQACADEP